VADPLVESDTDLQAIVEDNLRETLHLRGIALSDVEILRAMDGEDFPVALPAMLGKTGEVRSSAKALELPALQALLEHARETATALAEGIFSGQTDIRPTQSGGRSACDFCGFGDICGFHPDIPGAAFTAVPGMDMDELRERLGFGDGGE
jgi:ATP-dependent helicase/nuclease subunit B